MNTKYKGQPTTRSYPRTLAEAFPDSHDRAEWFYPPEKRQWSVLDLLLITFGISTFIGLAYFFAKN